METGQSKVVSGPFTDLIRQFSVRHHLTTGEPGSTERLAILGSLLEAPRSTVEGWFKNSVPPAAGKARKVQLLLSLCGYEADERSELSPVMRVFADTLSTVISVEAAATELGLVPDNMHIWLRGQKQPKDIDSVVRLNEKYTDKRLAKIRVWKRTLQEHGFVSDGAVPEKKSIPIVTEPQETPVPQGCSTEHADETIIHLMKALGTMLRMCGVLSDDARKKAIRQAVGHAEIADLLGDLQKLYQAPFNLS